jgi:hypothetical protein
MIMAASVESRFWDLVRRADEAGRKAAEPAKGTAVVITDGRQDFDLDDWPCGFAWVEFAGNTPFGRWAKETGLAKKAYPKGLSIWISAYGQSMTKKAAYAAAYAEVLRADGIVAYAGSRMD